MTDTDRRYRALVARLIARHARAAAMHDRERAAHHRAAEDAAFWRNLTWLAAYSGRNGIRGDRLLPGSTMRRAHIPAQRRPPAAEQRPRAGRPR